MGGREVGGLANMLAAHMETGNPEHRRIVKEHWRAPRIAESPGLKAVDLFRAVRECRIKAIWIMATNPAVSMPESHAIAEALKACPFVVVSDVTARTETAQFAHVLLPAAAWGEKDGTVTNSERCISRQRKFLAPPGEARPDWRIISDVAIAMGFSGFDYHSPAAIFREHASLSARSNSGDRAFNLEGFESLSESEYDALAPFQWLEAPFTDGMSLHPGGRLHFVPTPSDPEEETAAQYLLNTGRIRDQWHTMTRTGKVPRLFSVCAEPFLEIHPADAAILGLEPADIAEVEGPGGQSLLRVLITESVRQGEIFAPMHWSSPFASHGLVNHAARDLTDPVSGQPELKRFPVIPRKHEADWYAFAVTRSAPRRTGSYWSHRPVKQGFAVECVGFWVSRNRTAEIKRIAASICMEEVSALQLDSASGSYRAVTLQEGRLEAALFVSPRPVEVDRDFVIARLADDQVKAAEVLAGLKQGPDAATSPLVCICNGVRQAAIVEAAKQSWTLSHVCEATNAGTSCGACRPAIERLVAGCALLAPAAE
jgi:assimilatory nitrate reductase catalytic subunit